MSLTREEALELIGQLESGELTESDFYEQQAIARIDSTDFNVPLIGSIGSTFLGFALLGPLGAFGMGVAAASMLVGRHKSLNQQRIAIESGDVHAIYNALPDDYKPVYPYQPKSNSNSKSHKVEATPSAKAPTFHPTLERMAQVKIPIDLQPKPVVEAPQFDQLNSTDTAQKIADRGLRCHLFLGGSGTGKSLIASESAKRIKQQNPDTQVWILSAKTDSNESGYWSGFDRYHLWDFVLGDFDLKAQAFEDWTNAIAQFRRLQQPSLLIFDELSLGLGEADTMVKSHKCAAAQAFKTELTSLLNVFASAGRSSQKAVWGISPTGAMNGLGGLRRSQIGAFLPVFNAKLDNEFHHNVWQDAANNGLAPTVAPSFDDEFKAKQNGCTLMTGLGDRWHPTQQYMVPHPDASVIRQYRHYATVQTVKQPQTQQTTAKPMDGMRDYIRNAIAQGKGKTETLKSLGLKPGGSQEWKNGSELFDLLKGNQPNG